MISWREDDEVSACFDEEMQYLGQNAPMQPSVLLGIPLEKSGDQLDVQVQRVFGYAGAMLRSLAAAAKIVAIVRGIHDEDLRRDRLKSGLQVEPRLAGVRDQQL
jgi:hypothetical protein